MATILIVDDIAVNRQFLTSLLGYGGHRLLEAVDGAHALRIVRDEHPDLVIADILMPTMDGYEFVHHLRADSAIAATPVIFYTATYHEREARMLAESCGVLEVLTKPCEPEAMLAAVERAIKAPISPAATRDSQEFEREHRRILTDTLSKKADELQRINSRLQAIVNLGLEIGSERIVQHLLEKFCAGARDIVCARVAMVGILNSHKDKLRYFITAGMDPDTARTLGTPSARPGLLGRVLDEGRTIHACVQGDERLDLPEAFPPARSFLAIPIVSPAKTYGWLCLLDKVGADDFNREDEQVGGMISAQLGRVYENGSLYADLIQHSIELKEQIAERARAELALKDSEQRIRLLLDSTAEAIYGVDKNGLCTFSNKACEKLLGYSHGELLGKEMHSLLQRDGSGFEDCPICNVLVTGSLSKGQHDSFHRSDGTTFSAEFWSHPLYQDGRLVGAVVTFWDISEKVKLEEQLRQSQKMEAVGSLAGGVAHDFNNILTVINGYSEVIIRKIDKDSKIIPFVNQIRAAGERAANLTHQLLAFSRKQKLAPVVLEMNGVISDLSKMLPRLIGEDIELSVSLEPELWRIKADRGQLDQVIMNLVVNARDAMTRGGRIDISTSNVEIGETRLVMHDAIVPGEYARLVIEDTGCGMDEATMSRIFEPFFTTKGPEKGTGLGLATVYGILKQSGAYVDIYSQVGVGSSFKIYFPRVSEGASAPQSAPPVAQSPRGTETVLLVEDAEGVRSFARMVLQENGYHVIEASNGEEALRKTAEHKGRIHIMVSDVVMPRMSGPEIGSRLRQNDPALKVLYTSGYTDESVILHGLIDDTTPFLEKPYGAEVLARRVRQTLDS